MNSNIQASEVCRGSFLPPKDCFGQLKDLPGFTAYKGCVCSEKYPLTEEERAKLLEVAQQKMAAKAARVNARLMQSCVIQPPLVNPYVMPLPLPPLHVVSVPVTVPLPAVPLPAVPLPEVPLPAVPLPAVPLPVLASRLRADAPEFFPFRVGSKIVYCWSHY